jgi:type II secretory pathway pseudopilin PulG
MRAWIRSRIEGSPEAGLTMVEVLVASVVLVLGAAATFGILGAAARNAQRAKATQVALDLAQEELEQLHSVPYDELAVSEAPSHENGEQKPNSRIDGNRFALQRKPPNSYFPLVVEPERGISPASHFNTGESGHGGIEGTIYRYVVWRNDPSCTTSACQESEDDYKQIVVAVKPDTPVSQKSETGYVEVQSAVTAPAEYELTPQEEEEQKLEEEEKKKQEEEEREGGGHHGSEVTAQQFFLSDTPCAASGATVRVEPTANNPLHNTLGTCASGSQTGNTLGAPDALLETAPLDPYPEDESLPYMYDFSDDLFPSLTPATAKGVQIRRDDTSGCHYNPTGTTYPASQVHRWVTDPLPHAFEMNGRVVLDVYTRTLDDALYTGALCVYLFERKETGSGQSTVAEDTMLINKAEGTPYWVYEPQGNGYWPRNSWAEVLLTMEFAEAPRKIPAGRRLGLALSVDRANTPAEAIPIMYDHPNYASRIEVDTDTPLEGEG